MKFSDRIKDLRKKNGLTQVQFAEKFDIGLATIAMWESSQRKPPSDMLIKLANYFGVTVDYLLGVESSNFDSEDIITFPVLAGVSAGFNHAFDEIESGETQEIPRSIIKGRSPKELAVFLVKGDSMFPKFLDGDRVLVSKQPSVDNGDIAVVCYEDFERGTIKKVHYEINCDYVDLIPLNPKYSPVRIQGNNLEGISVIGKVIYLFREI